MEKNSFLRQLKKNVEVVFRFSHFFLINKWNNEKI